MSRHPRDDMPWAELCDLYHEAMDRVEAAEAERDDARAAAAGLRELNRKVRKQRNDALNRAEAAEADRDFLRPSWHKTMELLNAAEATLTRVKALRDEWQRNEREYDPWYWSDAAEELTAALNGETDE